MDAARHESPQTVSPDRVAAELRVRGVVQGVGFRPFAYRLANRLGLAGRVGNGEHGVTIHLEGPADAVEAFSAALRDEAPAAARIDALERHPAPMEDLVGFRIAEETGTSGHPTALISPDLAACPACLRELRDPGDRRHGYPYLVCTDCGPRYSIVLGLPYDRPRTTMQAWPLCPSCDREYRDPGDRRFHAQPTACPACGPHHSWRSGDDFVRGDSEAIGRAVDALRSGKVVAIKGVGGYHLCCDARDEAAVLAVRTRKYRKEKPFALMARDLEVARGLVELSEEAEAMLSSPARPIVLARAKGILPGVAPENGDLGVMLPSTPLHALLFDGGAPGALVMTSGNRSSEPIAIDDEEALRRLSGIADGFLIGDRPIARRVEDSIVRDGPLGPVVLRRARGLSPGVAAEIPAARPILGVGGDLKGAVTLVVGGSAVVGPHLGDLEHREAIDAFRVAIADLIALYGLDWSDVVVAHDRHPHYRSTIEALGLPAPEHVAVQHHRAHVASVLAERGEWHRRVLGICADGTGFGDDGAIWGGELFVGSVAGGFDRVLHLRTTPLPGGDSAARWPVMAAAGFLCSMDDLPDLSAPPFLLPDSYDAARRLLDRGVRAFPSSSIGRLFDAASALVGFTRENTFEGQAAIRLEQLARSGDDRGAEPYPFPVEGGTLDPRPLLRAILRDRLRGLPPARIARRFHRGIARGLAGAIIRLCEEHTLETVVLSGGVFQNGLLLGMLVEETPPGIELWSNRVVPPNDGGISLGQVAMAAFSG